MTLNLAPRLEKRPSNLGGQFATLGTNVLAFISNLGPNNKPKMLKVGPKFFWPLTPSVKWALMWTLISCESSITFLFGQLFII
jgi:hypothetical protein